jgi:hypothetical protein
MILYADQQFKIQINELLLILQKDLRYIETENLDLIRQLLIRIGQLEQGVEDAIQQNKLHPSFSPFVKSLTDEAAALFYSEWKGITSPSHPQSIVKTFNRKLQNSLWKEITLTIKVPEGFEFYALYPEQYAESAIQFVQTHPDHSAKILVVGIRSIGTTLSAIVTEILQRHHFRVDRITVRPTGHPFARTVQLNIPKASNFKFAIIVDEGPGLSGSSMISTAEALLRIGISQERIFLFPGSGHSPGKMASDKTLYLWNKLRKYFTPISAVRWNGSPLEENICSKIQKQKTFKNPCIKIQDISYGRWRAISYSHSKDWPIVSTIFEKQKYYFQFGDKRVIAKFLGLGSITEINRSNQLSLIRALKKRSQLNWCPPVIAESHGFTCFPWIKGFPITRYHQDYFLPKIAQYLKTFSNEEISLPNLQSALSRLLKLIYWNTRESLENKYLSRLHRFLEKVSFPEKSLPCFIDGRMEAHHWIHTTTGTVQKISAYPHYDHTIIGQQPILWDIAAFIVEAELNHELETKVFQSTSINQSMIHFYQLAYLSFKIGLFSISSDSSKDDQERKAFQKALCNYQGKLRILINSLS